MTKKDVVITTVRIEKDLHIKFRKKLLDEEKSIIEKLHELISEYVKNSK